MKRRGKKEARGEHVISLYNRNGIFPSDSNCVSNVDTTL